MRGIRDAKDLNTNELVYFIGHAQATYMSDGSTVEDSVTLLKNKEVYTKAQIDSKIGDINTILESIING